MPILSNNEIIAPFLSKPMSFIKGLDPLGLQNTSEATFALLLPGLNNVTGRIRYYSFYCWLLQEYAKRIGSTDPAEQRKFIRRAELIIALVNRSTEDEVGGIPGSNYANRQLKEGYSVHDLISGTYNEDGSTEQTYWKNTGGAFGQYYKGSLNEIGLISEREKGSEIYVRGSKAEGVAVSGEDLADAFDKNIQAENKELFFSCIKKGKIKSADFDSLFKDFNLSKIPKQSQERQLLLTLLTQKDFPQLLEEKPLLFRKQTIKHVLDYANKNDDLSDRSFTIYAYVNKGKISDVVDECLSGWYYYQLNEFWQYASLGVFNGILDYLGDNVGSSWKNLYQLIEEVVKKTIKHFLDEEIIFEPQETIGATISNSEEWVDEVELFQLIKDSENTERVAYSMLLIFSLYRNNLPYFERLKEFGINKQVEKDGDSVTYFMKFEKYLKLQLGDFLKEFFLKNIIYRHQFVAFRKMSSSSQSTQLFIIEDDLIRKLKNNFDPTLTGPRIARLIRFLSDLQILNADAQPTKDGLTLLNQLASEAN